MPREQMPLEGHQHDKTLLEWFHRNSGWYDSQAIHLGADVPEDDIDGTLNLLKWSGWIESQWQEEPEPARRVYRLTPRPDTALTAGLQLHLTADDLRHLEPEQIKELFAAIGTVARFNKPRVRRSMHGLIAGSSDVSEADIDEVRSDMSGRG